MSEGRKAFIERLSPLGGTPRNPWKAELQWRTASGYNKHPQHEPWIGFAGALTGKGCLEVARQSQAHCNRRPICRLIVMDDDGRKLREHRRRVVKRATILLGLNKSEIPCSVRNQHAGEAELVVPVGAMVPERFMVYVPIDDIAYETVIRWCRGDRMGVQFVGQGQSPNFIVASEPPTHMSRRPAHCVWR